MAAARDFRMVFVMAANEDEARKIAQALVEERLAACVNIVGPVHSIYRWRGTIESANEFMLVIKTSMRHFSKLEQRVRELHSYEVPEIVAVTLAAGSKPYVAWLAESTRQAAPSTPVRLRRRSGAERVSRSPDEPKP
ncbi:MAG: divalent-cation tolerance protein CutA [Deltaproteobacteria bacterium]|nr:divalent-cation tolerance protein CutA [Deltaproteobacteria bacterium]